MFSYDAVLNWPDQPPALALLMLRRYAEWKHQLRARWEFLVNLDMDVAPIGAEVFEAAVSTVADFYRDSVGELSEEWDEIAQAHEATENLWLELPDIITPGNSIQAWVEDHPGQWPPATRLEVYDNTQVYVQETWIVWRMTVLFVTESAFKCTARHWRSHV